MVDDIDARVLNVLKEDGRATVRTIAKRLNLPISTVHHRLRKLREEKVIRHFTVALDHVKLDLPVLALVSASVSHERLPERGGLDALKKKLKELAGVERIYILTGDVDLVLLVRVRSIAALDEFLTRQLRSIPEIAKTTTQVVLEE